MLGAQYLNLRNGKAIDRKKNSSISVDNTVHGNRSPKIRTYQIMRCTPILI